MPARLLLLTLLCLALPLYAGLPDDSLSARREILPGVLYRHLSDPRGPWEIHILEIDLSRPGLSLRGTRAGESVRGRETLSSMAARYRGGRVIAAINADFFSLETGESTNSQVVEGECVKGIGGARALPRSQFGMGWDGRPFIGRTVYRGSVTFSDGASLVLGGVNIPPDSGWVTMYNRWYGAIIPDSMRALALAHLHLAPAGVRGDTSLYVPSPSGMGAPALVWRHGDRFPVPGRASDTLRVVERFEPLTGRVRTLVGGAPRIVRDGKSVAGRPEFMEGTTPEFSSKRHPRTGVGYAPDGSRLWWFVVDGRQAASAGMTLQEFAGLMLSTGVTEGLNLDGGGSTVMVVGGTIVNVPSDAAGERPIANGLLLVADPLPEETR